MPLGTREAAMMDVLVSNSAKVKFKVKFGDSTVLDSSIPISAQGAHSQSIKWYRGVAIDELLKHMFFDIVGARKGASSRKQHTKALLNTNMRRCTIIGPYVKQAKTSWWQ